MKTIFKIICLSALTISFAYAKTCDEKYGKYGNDIQYQNAFCTFFISSTKINSDSYRNVTFSDTGLVQFFSNFPGTTNSNSTGARVYYFFPVRGEKEITSVDTNNLNVKHSSGVNFNFDKNGNITSPDLKMKIDKNINSKNKGGVEVESYSKGLVIDIGYRMGNSPTLNKNATVTITDKNSKKCTMPNSDFHSIDKYNVELKYKTNEAMHRFLKGKCPGLDLSDLKSPISNEVQVITKPSSLGAPPALVDSTTEHNNPKREEKKYQSLDAPINNLDKNNTKEK